MMAKITAIERRSFLKALAVAPFAAMLPGTPVSPPPPPPPSSGTVTGRIPRQSGKLTLVEAARGESNVFRNAILESFEDNIKQLRSLPL